MPETLLNSGSEFDHKKAVLDQWLREYVNVKSTLTKDALRKYGERKFISGWDIEIEHKNNVLSFHVLIDRQFPYSAIRVAYRSQDVYLKWPHVESQGLFCLPLTDAPSAGIEDTILKSLRDSLTLIEQCQDKDYLDQEFRCEFLSYWSRHKHPDTKPVRSLLDITNHSARKVAVWYGQGFTLVGETSGQVCSWLKNWGRTEPSNIAAGVFGFLNEEPIPPFPKTTSELYSYLQEYCPEICPEILNLPINQDMTVVLGAKSETGEGLISLHLSAPNLDGFRNNKIYNANTKLGLWKMKSQLKRLEVERYDSAWIHGRGVNKKISILQVARVLILGCGSLGSQVAARLAQSGIGNIILVDPDILAPANVGRHYLGIDSTGVCKASRLAENLRTCFPHISSLESHDCSWQDFYERDAGQFESANLIVACLGEWSADGQLGEWQSRQQSPKPIIYGWLDEQGTAAHALALTGECPALNCILNPEGSMRVPESVWRNDRFSQTEPACGTLFQPYGPINVANAEALVSKLCIDILAGDSHPPVHRVYAGPTAKIVESGGEWSTEHLKYRPEGFNGAFEYERPVLPCGSCPVCLERQ